MLRIKFSYENLRDYSIDIDIYREHTNKDRERFIQYRDKIKCHYAICPKCENPAIVLGLFKEIEGRVPHARHTKHDVEGIGKFVQRGIEKMKRVSNPSSFPGSSGFFFVNGEMSVCIEYYHGVDLYKKRVSALFFICFF